MRRFSIEFIVLRIVRLHDLARPTDRRRKAVLGCALGLYPLAIIGDHRSATEVTPFAGSASCGNAPLAGHLHRERAYGRAKAPT